MLLMHRLEKRVMVPLPVAQAREQMMRKNLNGRASDDLDYAQVSSLLIICSLLVHPTPSYPILSYPIISYHIISYLLISHLLVSNT